MDNIIFSFPLQFSSKLWRDAKLLSRDCSEHVRIKQNTVFQSYYQNVVDVIILTRSVGLWNVTICYVKEIYKTGHRFSL
jgi:hypothetical protein